MFILPQQQLNFTVFRLISSCFLRF